MWVNPASVGLKKMIIWICSFRKPSLFNQQKENMKAHTHTYKHTHTHTHTHIRIHGHTHFRVITPWTLHVWLISTRKLRAVIFYIKWREGNSVGMETPLSIFYSEWLFLWDDIMCCRTASGGFGLCSFPAPPEATPWPDGTGCPSGESWVHLWDTSQSDMPGKPSGSDIKMSLERGGRGGRFIWLRRVFSFSMVWAASDAS